jgi:hypothetical protein
MFSCIEPEAKYIFVVAGWSLIDTKEGESILVRVTIYIQAIPSADFAVSIATLRTRAPERDRERKRQREKERERREKERERERKIISIIC